MPDRVISGWRRQVRRPLFIGVAAVVAVLVAGGAAAFAASGSGGSGYRLTKVVRASVDNSLVVVGSVEPVKTASASFQVAGQVATVTAAVGQQVTAGQGLGTLDTTALSESVSSAQSSLNADEAKLTEDENSQTSSTPAATSTTTTTAPARGPTGTSGGSGSASSQITKEQAALVADQSKASAAQAQESADLSQAESTCESSSSSSSPPQGPPASGTTTTTTTAPSSTTTTTTPPPTDASGCTTALEQVSSDQQTVSHAQGTVATDEDNLAKDLAQEASSASSSSTHSSTPASSTSSTSSASSFGPSSSSSSSSSGGGGGGGASAAVSDSPAQIDSDQAGIDTAEANLVMAEQSLADAQLTSPISGTIASVGLSVGATVGANSSSDAVVIVGTQSFEATSTLTSAQVVSVKVGQTAEVTVDGSSGSITGTVSQVGPVQVSSGTYSYPVVIALPASATGLFSGSSANISIFTSAANNVLAVPTSAVLASGTRTYVLVLSGGTSVEKTVKTGIVGNVYTQVLSGLQLGASVVLANDSQAVPASSATTLGGFGGFGGAGGGGRFNITQVGPGGGGGSGVTQIPVGG